MHSRAIHRGASGWKVRVACDAIPYHLDPNNPHRLWTGISAVGVFRSDDRGKTWQLRNEGLPVVIPSNEHPGIGSCVHGLALDPQNSNRLFQIKPPGRLPQ